MRNCSNASFQQSVSAFLLSECFRSFFVTTISVSSNSSSANIVKKFDEKTMAVVGFEIDQVFKGENGAADTSVPINVAYNHHFESEMLGKGAVVKEIKINPSDPRYNSMGHGRPDPNVLYEITDDNNNNNDDIPSHQAFGAGNGGEYRKSFHGYSPGYAQLIQSPQSIYITPMQIDTWNRDKMNKTDPTGKFVSGKAT